VRVFLDANVLFSASYSGSNIARLIQLLLDKGAAVTSEYALEEARRNVNLKRPTWAEDFERLAAQVEVAPSVSFELSVELAEKDVSIMCTAVHAGCETLATGDKRHFGHLYGQVVSGVRVVTLFELAQMLTTDQPQ
jgi:predicted nucleic acid-binding protein